MKGGNGMRLKYSNPMYLDDVAVDFPEMQIIMAHPSFPGRKKRYRSPSTSRMFILIYQDGAQNISRNSGALL